MTTKVQDKVAVGTATTSSTKPASRVRPRPGAIPLLIGLLGLGTLATMGAGKQEQKIPRIKATLNYKIDHNYHEVVLTLPDGEMYTIVGHYNSGDWYIPDIIRGVHEKAKAVECLSNWLGGWDVFKRDADLSREAAELVATKFMQAGWS